MQDGQSPPPREDVRPPPRLLASAGVAHGCMDMDSISWQDRPGYMSLMMMCPWCVHGLCWQDKSADPLPRHGSRCGLYRQPDELSMGTSCSLLPGSLNAIREATPPWLACIPVGVEGVMQVQWPLSGSPAPTSPPLSFRSKQLRYVRIHVPTFYPFFITQTGMLLAYKPHSTMLV
uniref:Uncharacterized protein n=1 Tax=Setaria viridis TaxID=4556 RepID=A0A4U6U5V6_SETVI|nr:hypothetical protein SEVIR_6G202200v2 [Setaria viridis]